MRKPGRPAPRRLARIATLAGAASAALVLTANGAQAHNTLTYHGSDYVAVGSNHRTTSVCDRENDGHWVSGQYKLVNGSAPIVYDTTYNGQCTNITYAVLIREYRVCEQGEGCTPWRYT